ncbi:aminotransferase [Phlyctema vagabunda]|uniref:Aminotransferase n=1 Tax=Phlyctema vagabunda TaxID=108571 RepID=A0ABR4PS99_9HELO
MRMSASLAQKNINLLRGWPNSSLLPVAQLLDGAQTAFTTPSIYTPGLAYGPDPGYQPLREEIARWLASSYPSPLQAAADPETICISGGASQNLACALQVFSDPAFTRKIFVVAPCYFLACRIFEDAGFAGRLCAIPEGEEGVDLDSLRKGLEEVDEEDEKTPFKPARPWAKLYKSIIYCVPTFSNPSGKTMSMSCRQSLVKLARRHNSLIISDDVYDFLSWSTSTSTSTSTTSPSSPGVPSTLPRLIDIDRSLDPIPGPEDFGHAMSNGSFSKIAGPGMRTGWADASRKLIYGLSQCGSSRSGGAPSQMSATIMCSFLASGALAKHIDEVLRPAYQRRWRIMVEAIEKYLLPLGIQMLNCSSSSPTTGTSERTSSQGQDGAGIYGGYFIWLDLPTGVDAETLVKYALQKENLVVPAGPMFAVEGDQSLLFRNSIRLCFSWEAETDLAEGVKRLSRALRDVQSGKQLPPTDAHGLTGTELKQSMGEFQ